MGCSYRAGPGSNEMSMLDIWHHMLDPNFDRKRGRTGTRTKEEDIKLKMRHKHTVARIGVQLSRYV
jgi:hypothetical protein